MSSKIVWIVTLSFFLFSGVSFGQKPSPRGMEAKERNYSTFSKRSVSNLEAWKEHNDPADYTHPEFGFLPYNAPCSDCIELIEERTMFTRKFIPIGKNGKEFKLQKGYAPLHFKDAQNRWITLDPLLKQINPKEFEVSNEFYRIHINTDEGSISYQNLHQQYKPLSFHKNLTLEKIAPNGNVLETINSNWSNFIAGDDGVMVIDIFPGIDLEININGVYVKTNFIVKANQGSEFRIREELNNSADNVILNPVGKLQTLQFDYQGTTSYQFSEIKIFDKNTDRNAPRGFYQVNGDFLYYSWDAKDIDNLTYPFVIDPTVSSSNTLPQASIGGSGLNNAGAFTTGCLYNLTVPTPPNCTITDIDWTFSYIAQNGATMSEGACKFYYGACESPSTPGFFWFCNDPLFGGTCNGANISIFSDFSSCVPGPQCASYDMDFTMEFFDAFAGPSCSNLFIGPASDWTMTITGETLAYTNITNPITVSSNTVCEGESINVSTVAQDGVPAYTYDWSFNASGIPSVGTGANASVTFPTTGTVTLYSIVTDNCGQVSTASETITVTPNPTPTITGDTDYCQGQTAAISTGAFSSYSWTNGASTQNTTVTDADNPITVTVTDANGCTGTSAPFSVTENPSPTPTITGSSTYCTGQTAAISTQAGFSNYSWSNGASTQNTNVTDADNPITVTVTDANGCTGTSPTFSVSEQANITYSETVEICQGQSATIHGNTETTAGTYAQTFTTPTCDSIATITLVVNPLPTITASATIGTLCEGESTDLSASGGDTYSWDTGLGTGANHTVNPTSNTTYTVTGTDANGCENTADVTVTVNPLPTVDAGSDLTICDGDDATLNGSGTATSYSWDNGVSDGVSFTPPSGTTTYTLTGTDANGCENTDQVEITVAPSPTVNAGIDTTICEGESITLTGSGTATSYTWDNGVTDGSSFTPGSGTTTYTVTGTDANGCTATDVVDVNVIPQPMADFTATPMSGQPPLAVDFDNLSSNGTSYEWDFGNGSTTTNPSNTDESMTYTETGTYEVILTVTNGDCSDQASLFIVVAESPLNFVIPNVFTPNNDGQNDIFHMNVSNAESIEIEIFNRWGNLVGQINSLDPADGWDGTNMGGSPVPDGVYFYTYKIVDLQGEEVTGHQYIHLERD